MAHDSISTSEQLMAAWKAVTDRLEAAGYGPDMVADTMLAVALRQLTDLHGGAEATRRLLSMVREINANSHRLAA